MSEPLSPTERFFAILNGEPLPPEPEIEPVQPPVPDRPPRTLLESTSRQALVRANEILRMKIDPADGNFGHVIRAQVSVINSALAVQARVDEVTLKAKTTDVIPKLLLLIEEERRKLPPLDDEIPARVIDAKALMNLPPAAE
jgi:hypothetical protein